MEPVSYEWCQPIKKQVVSIAILLTAVGASGLLCMLFIGVGFWAEQLANMNFVEFNLAINLLWLGVTGALSLVLGFGVSLMFNLHKMKTQLRQSRNEYKKLALLLSFGIFLIAYFVVTFNLYGVFNLKLYSSWSTASSHKQLLGIWYG